MCFSYTECGSFKITKDAEGFNMLTNLKNDRFTISELEVWEVKGYMLEDQFVEYDKEEIERIRIEKLEPRLRRLK